MPLMVAERRAGEILRDMAKQDGGDATRARFQHGTELPKNKGGWPVVVESCPSVVEGQDVAAPPRWREGRTA